VSGFDWLGDSLAMGALVAISFYITAAVLITAVSKWQRRK
jgi:hypothetical protein